MLVLIRHDKNKNVHPTQANPITQQAKHSASGQGSSANNTQEKWPCLSCEYYIGDDCG
jgi:hypothetical protein